MNLHNLYHLLRNISWGFSVTVVEMKSTFFSIQLLISFEFFSNDSLPETEICIFRSWLCFLRPCDLGQVISLSLVCKVKGLRFTVLSRSKCFHLRGLSAGLPGCALPGH